MAIPYWKRMREIGAQRRDADAPAQAATPTAANPWGDPADVAPEPLPTIDLDALTRPDELLDAGQRAAQYNDWAERMRAKRQRAKAVYAGGGGTDSPPEAEVGATYWTTDAVFAEGRRVADNEVPARPNPWRVQELLEVLDLRDDATPADVNHAYRRLAKQHHPDRYVEADDEIRRFHEERMAVINQAYATLRQLERA
ncbi:MAG: J domain-containing protein [Acidimicrobiales bacterium]